VLALLGAEVLARHERHTLLQRKVLGSIGHQQHVRALLHHQPRELDGILHVPHGRHRTGTGAGAAHDGRIELGIAVLVEHRTAPGIELRIILHRAHRGGHRIEARAATLEHGVTGIERRGEPVAIGSFACRRHLGTLDDAGAAVDDDGDRWGCGAVGRAAHQPGRDEQQRENCRERRARHRFLCAAMIEALTTYAVRGRHAPRSGR